MHSQKTIIKNNNNLDQDYFSVNEEIEARKNWFILLDSTDSGKTTLLNDLFGKEVGQVKSSLLPETIMSLCYYYKLENGGCYVENHLNYQFYI